jgi:hypothetical protein
VNRARVPSSLRKHLRNQKSDSCPGLWAAVRLVGYQGSEPTAPILVTATRPTSPRWHVASSCSFNKNAVRIGDHPAARA